MVLLRLEVYDKNCSGQKRHSVKVEKMSERKVLNVRKYALAYLTICSIPYVLLYIRTEVHENLYY